MIAGIPEKRESNLSEFKSYCGDDRRTGPRVLEFSVLLHPKIDAARYQVFPHPMIQTITIQAAGQGLHEFTRQVEDVVRESRIPEGLCTLFIRHTSASLVIQENADPDVQTDLEAWMHRLVKEDDPLYTHTVEGPDDMPAHIKGVLTATSLSIPILNGRLGLGTWQGIYLWEHRRHRGQRQVLVHIGT